MELKKTLRPEPLDGNDLLPGGNKVNFFTKTIGGDLNLAGLLFVPEGFSAQQKYPAVVLVGGFNQIKEQACSNYARRLALRGLVALCFDHPGYGDSEGAIRNYEYAPAKVEAIQDAVSFLRMQAFVNRDAVFGVGVCSGGTHMAYAAVTDKRLKRVALVGGMLAKPMIHFTSNGTQKSDEILARANEARQMFYETGVAEPFDALNLENGSAPQSSNVDERESYDYYMTARAGAATFPKYSHRTPEFFIEDSARHSARAIAGFMNTPAVVIYGSKASTRFFSYMFYWSKTGAKKLVSIKGATQVDLYDRHEYVEQAVDTIASYFEEHSVDGSSGHRGPVSGLLTRLAAAGAGICAATAVPHAASAVTGQDYCLPYGPVAEPGLSPRESNFAVALGKIGIGMVLIRVGQVRMGNSISQIAWLVGFAGASIAMSARRAANVDNTSQSLA